VRPAAPSSAGHGGWDGSNRTHPRCGGELDLLASTDDGTTFDPMPTLPVQENIEDPAIAFDGTLHLATSGAIEFHPGT
jgi:hypothetical protein